MQNTFLNLHFKYSSPWHFKRPFPRSFFECCMPFCQEEKKQKKQYDVTNQHMAYCMCAVEGTLIYQYEVEKALGQTEGQ